MKIQLAASLKPFSDFREAYKPTDRDATENGTSLLFRGMKNTLIPDRYEIANFLLDQGCAIGGLGSGGASILHVLFGHAKHEIDMDVILTRRLINAGADINALDAERRLPFLEVLNMKYVDEDLQPVYDIWFERSDADFTTESSEGVSPLKLAAKLPYRASVLKQMERYVEAHS